MSRTVRVAATQFAIGTDLEANLQTCLRMIDTAVAKCRPELMVLPEFCNHLSWYEDKAHCYAVSVDLEGDWVGAIREAAKRHALHLVVNCTVRREQDVATGTSILVDPAGAILATSDKQVLMGHENDFLRRAREVSPIVETPVGRLGLYACMDGVINETPRGLALRGAEVLCNSLNSFALDEASLHVPVRAPENRVFVVAANKVGPLIPEALLEPVSQATSIPVANLYGAGESQIVGPDGTVLAKASRTEEDVVFADIDPSLARDKRRPDGTDVFASRRPELYRALAAQPPEHSEPSQEAGPGVAVAVHQPRAKGEDAVSEVLEVIQGLDPKVRVLVLPELFCFERAEISDLLEAVTRSDAVVAALAEACPPELLVVTSLVDASHHHAAVAIGPQGVVHTQPQLHENARHGAWVTLGNGVQVLELPWGRLGLVAGDDAIYPETFRLLALAGAEVVAAPIHVIESWEIETGLRERSAENRLCLVAATRPDIGSSCIMTLHSDFTLLTPWKSRVFDGNISDPLVTWADAVHGTTVGEVHPSHTHNKFVSRNTHVVDGRPWHLVDALTKSIEP